jgi:hypothetical protein
METPRWRRWPEGSNWGDFGPDDQWGRLNLIAREKLRQGLAEATEGIAFCLSLPLDYPAGNALNPRRYPPTLRRRSEKDARISIGPPPMPIAMVPMSSATTWRSCISNTQINGRASPTLATSSVADACCSILPLREHCLFKNGIHLGELWQLTPLAKWLRDHKRSRFLLTTAAASAGGCRVASDQPWRGQGSHRQSMGRPTQRSLEHFSIGKDLIPREMITGYAILKKAAANANHSSKRLDDRRHELIVQARDEILAGQHRF